MKNPSYWFGIDLYDFDARGRPCIATHKASVHQMPFENEVFDFVIANQSIEHWSEYGVSVEAGLLEVSRVLTHGGKININFPFFLHGDPLFMCGKIDEIIALFDPDVWNISSIIAYLDSSEPNYKGWRRCGFPDFYVKRWTKCETAFVVEIIASKKNIEIEKIIQRQLSMPVTRVKKITAFKRAARHGLFVLLWRIISKVKRLKY